MQTLLGEGGCLLLWERLATKEKFRTRDLGKLCTSADVLETEMFKQRGQGPQV